MYHKFLLLYIALAIAILAPPIGPPYMVLYNVSHYLCAAPGRTPLSWRTRIQISIDVANALVILRISFSLISLFGSISRTSRFVYDLCFLTWDLYFLI